MLRCHSFSPTFASVSFATAIVDNDYKTMLMRLVLVVYNNNDAVASFFTSSSSSFSSTSTILEAIILTDVNRSIRYNHNCFNKYNNWLLPFAACLVLPHLVSVVFDFMSVDASSKSNRCC